MAPRPPDHPPGGAPTLLRPTYGECPHDGHLAGGTLSRVSRACQHFFFKGPVEVLQRSCQVAPSREAWKNQRLCRPTTEPAPGPWRANNTHHRTDDTLSNEKWKTDNEKPANHVELIIDRLSVVSF
jgi:hypothetical protein